MQITDAVPASTDGMVCVITNEAKMYMPLAELVDIEKEIARIGREIEKAKGELARAQSKLANEKFTSRAPESVVQVERDKVEKANALIANLTETLKTLQ